MDKLELNPDAQPVREGEAKLRLPLYREVKLLQIREPERDWSDDDDIVMKVPSC